MAALIVAVVLVVVVLIVLAQAVRIVPQARAASSSVSAATADARSPACTSSSRSSTSCAPLVDLREQVVTFPPQPVITQDNVTISIDTVFYFTITDPFRATYEVANLLLAVEQLTVTTLRNVIGSLSLEEALTSRDKINSDLRIVLDEATERWGIRVNRIELKSIDPPGSIQEAMEKQMRAERDKRATILTAEGVKQSQILTAEGEKQAAILARRARSRRRSCARRARRGDAHVFKAIHEGKPSRELLTYQYIQALPQVADGEGVTLMIVPSDAIAAMGAIAALGGGFQSGQDAAGSEPSSS